MGFETSYAIVLQRAINRLNEWAASRNIQIDTREGSISRTAVSPFSFEAVLIYAALQQVSDEGFADTQSRPFLIRRAAERGLSPYPATFAIRQGEFNIDIPVGSRFSLNQLNYVALEKISDGTQTPVIYKMQCETAGVAGNLESGALIPINYINGLTFARLTDVLIPGEDEENTEVFRQRYFDSLNMQAFGGNIKDYIDKTTAIAGVGAVKVYRTWNGGGTVKLVILDSEYNIPSGVLIDEVQTAIDPEVNQGSGIGIAPIGHVVTVVGAGTETINIVTNITFASGWSWIDAEPHIQQAIDVYFSELAHGWDKVDWVNNQAASLIVRISQIETRILDVAGVIDIQNTLLNGLAQNIQLHPDNIPIRGSLTNV